MTLRAREHKPNGQFQKGIVLPLAERFWLKVDVRGPDECWPWLASTNPNGYGQIIDDEHGQMLKAHRVCWTLCFGPIPPGLNVLHGCDNPPCCNPRDLFLGTQAGNIADMVAKNRQNGGPPLGIRNNCKITEAQADEIRCASGLQRQIAARFGITPSQVSNIKSGKSWKHINDGMRAALGEISNPEKPGSNK